MRAVDEAVLEEAVALLRNAAPHATIILFGSHARHEGSEESDLDFLVIEPEVGSRFAEMVRLRDVLRPLRTPVDVSVTSEKSFKESSDIPGSLFYEAATQGRVFDAVA